jgi:hypothetical protein
VIAPTAPKRPNPHPSRSLFKPPPPLRVSHHYGVTGPASTRVAALINHALLNHADARSHLGVTPNLPHHHRSRYPLPGRVYNISKLKTRSNEYKERCNIQIDFKSLSFLLPTICFDASTSHKSLHKYTSLHHSNNNNHCFKMTRYWNFKYI